MSGRPHIVRLVSEEARRQFYRPLLGGGAPLRPRVCGEELGVELEDGRFVPFADLGYHGDIGFFALSDGTETNEAAPFAAAGPLIDLGQIMVTTGVTQRLTQEAIAGLLERHANGDFGAFGEFYELEVTEAMLRAGPHQPPGRFNKANTLTGLAPVFSSYVVDDHLIWIITEAGERRSTVMLYTGSLTG